MHGFLCRLYCAISIVVVTLQTDFSCFAPREIQDMLVGHHGEGWMLAASLCIVAEGDSRPSIPLVPVSTKASKKLKGIKPRFFFFIAQITVTKSTYTFARSPMHIYWGKSSFVVSAT